MADVDWSDEIRKQATALKQVAPDVAKGKGRAYEVWVMLSVARRCAQSGLTVEALDCADRPVTKLVVRKNPGRMAAAGAGPAAAGHLRLQGPYLWRAHEIHLGLQHVGSSGANHEIDLALLPAREAADFRSRGGGYWRGRTCVAVELKAYAEASKLDLGIARALVGIAYDLRPLRSVSDMTITFGGIGKDVVRDRWWGYRRPWLVLMTTASVYGNSRDLLVGHGGESFPGVGPGMPGIRGLDELADRFGRGCR